MKNFLFLSLLFLPFIVSAQCSECKTLEEALKDPAKVITLKSNGSMIAAKEIETLPASIGEMTKLQVLYLSDFQFTSIPPEIGNCQKLKEISFAGCGLTDLPAEIFTLKKLREIILLNNAFSDEKIKALEKKFKKEMPKTRVML